MVRLEKCAETAFSAYTGVAAPAAERTFLRKRLCVNENDNDSMKKNCSFAAKKQIIPKNNSYTNRMI